MAGRWNGERERRSVTRFETGQVSIASARFVRVVVEVCLFRQVVRLHRKR